MFEFAGMQTCAVLLLPATHLVDVSSDYARNSRSLELVKRMFLINKRGTVFCENHPRPKMMNPLWGLELEIPTRKAARVSAFISSRSSQGLQ